MKINNKNIYLNFLLKTNIHVFFSKIGRHGTLIAMRVGQKPANGGRFQDKGVRAGARFRARPRHPFLFGPTPDPYGEHDE